MDTQLSAYDALLHGLKNRQHTWLITGVAGFIGSNLLETLLKLDQNIVGLDNFSTGYQKNLDEVQSLVSKEQWSRFNFIKGDIRNPEDCQLACSGVEFVLHQAALGSVPRSIEDPISTNSVNISGFLNMLIAARDAGVRCFVYAASSSTYGDHPALPKIEDRIGRPLSPYAVTKYVNELYADVFAKVYGLNSIGLRYFNVFGKRQNPDGAYAAVIPKWINSLIKGEDIFINGDGETSRDFCYVANVIQFNILAATTQNSDAINQVFNVAANKQTTLNELYDYLCKCLTKSFPGFQPSNPIFRSTRVGDIRHSLADINKGQMLLGYRPTHLIADGIEQSIDWYISRFISQ